MKRIDKILLIIYACIVLLLSSCTPQIRMQKLISKHPEIIQTRYDSITIYIHDSVLMTFKGIDTTVIIKDSIILRDSISTTILYKTENGKHRIKREYKTIIIPFYDTIKTTVAVKNTLNVGPTKADKKKYRKQGVNTFVGVTISILIICLTAYIIIKHFKPFKLI